MTTLYSCTTVHAELRINMRLLVCAFVTKHPGQDHPFHSGGCWSLKVVSCSSYMLRGQEEQEEEGQIGSSVTDELDEGLTDE